MLLNVEKLSITEDTLLAGFLGVALMEILPFSPFNLDT
jgi:hypothetical protein